MDHWRAQILQNLLVVCSQHSPSLITKPKITIMDQKWSVQTDFSFLFLDLMHFQNISKLKRFSKPRQTDVSHLIIMQMKHGTFMVQRKIIMRSVWVAFVCGTIFGKWKKCTGSHNYGTMVTWKALKQVYQNNIRTGFIC